MHDRPALRALNRCLTEPGYNAGLLSARVALAYAEANRCYDRSTQRVCLDLFADLMAAVDEDAADPPCST